MTIGSGVGLFGSSLLVAAAIAWVLCRWDPGPRLRTVVVVLVLIACWIPVHGLALAGYVRGLTGDVSITTSLLLGMTLFTYVSGRELLKARERDFWFTLIAGAALFLYPMALGLGSYDPYVLGYGSYGFVTALAVVTFAAWRANHRWVVLSILAAAAACLACLLESTNLWDYLIDPLLACLAVFWLARRGWARYGRRGGAQGPARDGQ